MEKICIVKRRKKDVELVFSGFTKPEEKECKDEKPPVYTVSDVRFESESDGGNGRTGMFGERRFSVELTPAQTAGFQSMDWLTHFWGAKKERASFDVLNEQNKIVFNFHFKTIPSISMLSNKDVCHMLGVSASFLKHLVREGKIKSHKMGRLRRFALDDVLEYLCDTAWTGATEDGRKG